MTNKHRTLRICLPPMMALPLATLPFVGCTNGPPPVAPAPKPTAAVATPAPPPIETAATEGIDVGGDLLPPLPTAVTSFGAAQNGDHVYVLGGYHGTPPQYHREGQSRALWRVALSGDQPWEKVSELDAGLQGLALVAHGGEVCRFGGNRILNAEGEDASMLSVAEAACFDVTTRLWRDLPPMPSGRSSHEAAVIGSTVYVAGGWRIGQGDQGGSANDAVWAEDVVALNLATDEGWRSIGAPFKRRAVGVAEHHGKLAVIGGLMPDRQVSQEVSVLDPASGTWSRGPDYPSDAFGIAARSRDGAVIASARDGVVRRLDEAGWTELGSLTFPRFFHQLVPSEDGVVAIGGITGMQSIGRTRHTERVVANGVRVQEWSMAYPGAGKNRHGVLTFHDSVYFFGGNNSLGQHDFAPENFLSEGWRFHLPSLGFERVAAYPHKRQTMQTISLADAGISIGGFGHSEEAAGESQATSQLEAYRFDAKEESWQRWGGLPRGRTQFGLTEHDGKLWIFGGLNYDPAREGDDAFQHVTNVLVADVTGDGKFADAGVELPGPRRAFGGAALDGSYYIVGGMRGGFQLVDGCLRFDFAKQTFADMACPRANRLSAELIALAGKLYAVGGSVRRDGKMTPERSIEVYDPVADAWRVLLDDVGFDTKHVHALAYRDRLLLVSTHNDAGRVRVTLINPNDRG